MINYSKYTLNQLLKKLSTEGFFNLPNVVKEIFNKLITSPVDSRPYKVYVAKLSQSGTDAPEAVVLENTTGDTIVWSYFSVGKYMGTFQTMEFDIDKISPSISPMAFGKNEIAVNSSSVVVVNTLDVTETFANDVLVETQVEIRIYN